MSALLVDTHIFVRWRLEPDELTRPQQRALRIAENRSTAISISAMTIWELALLAAKGRIKLKEPLDAWLANLVLQPLIEVLPITPEIAATGAQLGSDFHNDPADRIIVATARCQVAHVRSAHSRLGRGQRDLTSGF
jgi:PIN domain nuclease of toxin-antitoxin system